ncbi:MAG TPA: hypothetical protein VMT28_11035 [Terriglobales bacterium]|jgi:hypothetical protein|nr:hypothetical protein [Terriglobales bacterium]
MTNERLSGLALLAGSAGVIITLALHPSGRGLFSPDSFAAEARKLIAVHSLALTCLPLWFLGACGVARRVGVARESDQQLGFAGLVFYGFALAAMMTAVIFDGLVSPGIAARINEATGTVGQGWRIAFNYNSTVDGAFVRVVIAASSVALLLWSVAILRGSTLPRALGVYGCLLSVATLVALLSGELDRYFHIFGAVLVGQTVWFVTAGMLLSRRQSA